MPFMMTKELRSLENSRPHLSLNDHYLTMERENINGTLTKRKKECLSTIGSIGRGLGENEKLAELEV